MEATSGFEPLHKGFADLPLSHLGTSPCSDSLPNFDKSLPILLLQRCGGEPGKEEKPLPFIDLKRRMFAISFPFESQQVGTSVDFKTAPFEHG